jgi:hypothetical protein
LTQRVVKQNNTSLNQLPLQMVSGQNLPEGENSYLCTPHMSTYFSTIIKAGNQLREFNFRLLAPTDPSHYAVDVPGENGERIRFHLVQEKGAWTITTAELPHWIYEAETAIVAAIQENKQKEAAQKNRML